MTGENATARQRRVWDKGAPGYDRQIAFFEKVWFTGGREWLGARARGRVLEVAIGTGRNLAHYPAAVTLTGVELSPEMLAIARRRAADLGREVDLHEGDAEHLPFADATYDTVVCALSLCTIPDPAAAIAEMRRVLVPGGLLLLLDHIRSTWPPVYAAQRLFASELEPAPGHLPGKTLQRPVQHVAFGEARAHGVGRVENQRVRLAQ